MPIQRESDTESDDNDSIGELPVVLPKYQTSQAKLDHLARARQRKAELALERAEQRKAEREETIALSKGVKKVKDPQAKEMIKKEILKATGTRQPKVVPPIPPPPPAPIQKARKQPQIVVEESEPEVIFVKRPKKKIVVEETETETEPEVRPKTTRRTARKPRVPVESESEYESEYDAPPTRKKVPPVPASRRPALQPPTSFNINF